MLSVQAGNERTSWQIKSKHANFYSVWYTDLFRGTEHFCIHVPRSDAIPSNQKRMSTKSSLFPFFFHENPSISGP